MRTYTIVVEPEDGGGYFVAVPALPGCFTRSSTIDECQERAVEAIEVHIAGLRPMMSWFQTRSGHPSCWPSRSRPDTTARCNAPISAHLRDGELVRLPGTADLIRASHDDASQSQRHASHPARTAEPTGTPLLGLGAVVTLFCGAWWSSAWSAIRLGRTLVM